MGLIGLYTTDEYGQEDFMSFERSGSVEYLAAFTTDCDYNYVRENLGIEPYQQHPTDTGQRLISFTNKRVDTSPTQFQDPTGATNTADGTPCYWWACQLQYGAINPLEISLSGNETDRPFGISFEWQVFEEAVDVAITGKNDDGTYQYSPVVNSAGDPFDPPVTRDQLRGVIGVEYNAAQSSYSPATDFAYGCLINNDTWNGFPAYTVKYTPPNMPARQYSQFLGAVYYRLQAQFVFNPYGWNATPIDRGFNYLSGGNRYKILDYQGMPLSTPSLLDGSGNVLPPGSTNYHLYNYQIYTDVSFNSTFPALTNIFSSITF